VVVVAIAVACAGIAAWLAARSLLLGEADESLRNRAERLARAPAYARQLARRGDSWRGAPISVRFVPEPPDDSVAVSWPDGLNVVPSDDHAIVAATADGRAFRLVRMPLSAPERGPSHWRRRAERFLATLSDDARLLVAIDVSDLHRDFRQLAWLLTATGTAAVLLAMAAAGRLRDALLAPLRRLGADIDALPPDDLDARLGSAALPPELVHIRARIDGLLERLAVARARERRTVADIAHELRTPLAVIRSELDFAGERGFTPEQLADFDAEVVALQRRVESLLLLSRLDAGAQGLRWEIVSVADVIADAWAPLSVRAEERGCQLVFSDTHDVDIDADPVLVRVLFGNLLGNAIAHGAPGTVTVTVERVGAVWLLRVRNPCADLTAGDRSSAFEPFWRQDSARSGGETHSGLGLTVGKSIADAHGAAIAARVDADGCFVVELRWAVRSADG